jgi:hypothetical protein
MSDHNQFEILCALAVVGQVSNAELRELNEHIAGCSDCKNRISGFAQISAQAFALSGKKYSKQPFPKAMTTRFVERARAEGIPLRASGQTLPVDLSFASFGWKGNLAASLLLVAMIAGGISKSVYSRAQSADRAQAARLELANEWSVQTRLTEEVPTPPQTKLLARPRQMGMSNGRFVESVHSRGRPNSEPNLGSFGPALTSPSIEYLANRQGETAFNSRVFSSEAKSGHPRLFQAYRRSSDRPWLVAPLPMSFADRSPLVNAADYAEISPGGHTGTFAMMSLNLPLHVFRFGSDRPLLSASGRARSDLNPNIEWYQAWLKMHTAQLQNANDPAQYHPGRWAPEWTFSKQSKVDQP